MKRFKNVSLDRNRLRVSRFGTTLTGCDAMWCWVVYVLKYQAVYVSMKRQVLVLCSWLWPNEEGLLLGLFNHWFWLSEHWKAAATKSLFSVVMHCHQDRSKNTRPGTRVTIPIPAGPRPNKKFLTQDFFPTRNTSQKKTNLSVSSPPWP